MINYSQQEQERAFKKANGVNLDLLWIVNPNRSSVSGGLPAELMVRDVFVCTDENKATGCMYLLSSGLVSAEHQLMALKLLLHVSPQLWVSLCRTSADGSEAPAAAACISSALG